MTLGELYAKARKSLQETEDLQAATFMARHIVCQTMGISFSDLFLRHDSVIDSDAENRIMQDISRLKQGEPFAYVLGNWEFFGLPMIVTPDVLIPRDDTCAVTELAIQHGIFLGKSPRILDLCCGSGCIGIAVASRIPDARVTVADISDKALAVAKKNISLNRLSGRVSAIQLDATKEAPKYLGKFDLIISNPPYITKTEMEELPDSVKNYEPHLALYGGEDGLEFYRTIIEHYTSVLNDGGFLAFEYGFGQGDAVSELLKNHGYEIVERKLDYNDRERAILARYGRKDVQ